VLGEDAMRRAWWLIVVAACGRGGEVTEQAPVGPVRVVGCELAWRPVADATEVVPVDVTPPAPPRPPPGQPQPGGEAPVVTVQTPNVVGGLGAKAVHKILRQANDAMLRCYVGRMSTRPGLAGNLDLDFTIGPDGKVVAPSAVGLDRALGQCFVRVLHTLEFGAPKGGGAKVRATVVVHPAASTTPEPVDEPEADAIAPAVEERPLATMAWADDGADAGLASWASDRVAPMLAAIDLAPCALGATGTLRAQLAFDGDGHAVDVEVDGVGSAAVEDCVRVRLIGATIAAPPRAAVATCALAVGAPQPARLTARPGQAVLEVRGAELRLDGAVVADLATVALRPAGAAAPLLIRATGATDGAALAAAVAAVAARGEPYVVGVEDASGGLAAIADGVKRGAGRPSATVGPRPRLELAGGRVIASIPGRAVAVSASLGDLASARAVLAEVAACGECERVVELVIARGTEARWLAEVAAWSAEAGLPRIVLARPI